MKGPALAVCCPLVLSWPPVCLFSTPLSCPKLMGHLPSNVCWCFCDHHHPGGGHRQRIMPQNTDFLAGRSKCKEEENTIEFVICPLTLGGHGPTGHKAVVIISNTAQMSKAAAENLPHFLWYAQFLKWWPKDVCLNLQN